MAAAVDAVHSAKLKDLYVPYIVPRCQTKLRPFFLSISSLFSIVAFYVAVTVVPYDYSSHDDDDVFNPLIRLFS